MVEMTEEEVEAIWAKSQYLMENSPAYAEACNRAQNLLRKLIDAPDSSSWDNDEEEQFAKACFEMYWAELMERAQWRSRK
jgi:hypothetical protein